VCRRAEIAATVSGARRGSGFRDIVTDADLAAQAALVSVIRSRFPQHAIFSEEGLMPSREAETMWVLDPLDGTTNYAHRYPCFSVSIGVVRGDEPVVGVVYDPLQDHLFCVERGAGATMNGARLRVSQTDQLIHALVALDYARDPHLRAEQMAAMVNCSRHIQTFRSLGSAALSLCYVAAGWLEAYFHWTLFRGRCRRKLMLLRRAALSPTSMACHGITLCRVAWQPTACCILRLLKRCGRERET
jgi:myo-inositol-1(or 4)-monophosphatase